MSSPVKVQIFGQTYTIHGELDPAYVQKLATFVDEKMRAISDATSTVDTHKIAVLAALSIADDAPTPFETVRANPLGTKKGYDPYDSGKLGKTREAPKKTDLRKLGDWLKLKKQAADKKDDD